MNESSFQHGPMMEQWLHEQQQQGKYPQQLQLKAEPPQSPPSEKRIRLDHHQIVQDWKTVPSQSIL